MLSNVFDYVDEWGCWRFWTCVFPSLVQRNEAKYEGGCCWPPVLMIVGGRLSELGSEVVSDGVQVCLVGVSEIF